MKRQDVEAQIASKDPQASIISIQWQYLEMLKTNGTSRGCSHETDTMVQETFSQIQWLIWCLCRGHFWHKRARCSYVYASQTQKYSILSLKRKYNGSEPITRLMWCVNIANPRQMLPIWSSFERLIWSLLGDRFGHEKAGCWYAGSILRHTSLHYIRKPTIERLITNRTPLRSLHEKEKNMVSWGHFVRFDG